MLAATLIAVVAWAGYTSAAVYRHQRFGSNAYDLGIYDQSIWGFTALGFGADNTVLRTPTLLIDHFQPLLVALAPLYWLWDDVRVLLVAQGALLAAASLPLFLWARRELGTPAALGLQTAFLLFWGVLAGNLYDFHDLAVAAPIVSLALYATLTRSDRLLIVALVLGLLTRETLALTFAALGVYVLVAQRRPRLGAAIVAVSVVWFALVFELVLPATTGTDYAHWFYPGLGTGPRDALVHLVTHPIDSLRILVTPESKQTALINLFAPWLFLPAASPLVLVLLPTLGERFFSDKPAHWAQGFHYTLAMSPILAIAAADGLRRLTALVGRRADLLRVAGVGTMLAAALVFSFYRMRPLDELERYVTDAQVESIGACLEAVPDDRSVAATSALVPHLSHRRRIYVLDDRPIPNVDVYALDRATWTFPLTADDIDRLERALRGRGYSVACERGSTTVLVRR